MDRVLGGPDNSKNVQRVLAQAEDREDVAAARVAEQEINETDAADFDENAATATATPAAAGTPRDATDTPANADTPIMEEIADLDEDELNAWGERVQSTDDFMLKFMAEELKDAPIELPKDKSKKGRDRSHRSHRAR
jgi:helicase SWR1